MKYSNKQPIDYFKRITEKSNILSLISVRDNYVNEVSIRHTCEFDKSGSTQFKISNIEEINMLQRVFGSFSLTVIPEQFDNVKVVEDDKEDDVKSDTIKDGNKHKTAFKADNSKVSITLLVGKEKIVLFKDKVLSFDKALSFTVNKQLSVLVSDTPGIRTSASLDIKYDGKGVLNFSLNSNLLIFFS